ncbi:MAG: 2Fe-2S iron-sulfur cluster binding domain-containing protein [Deltaproteobacteria bacterium]|nr:2Fe-2S iron-sulfur cluster binding domain-containing protein [Deltaproteobacteria bacterium]MCW5805290.1 2Fe-2S iron-sulfur cluster binding domain-containing protein [Deltaproteobacteria bacterium]
MPKVTFRNPHALTVLDPRSIDVKKGTSILDAAEECGARVGHACGGNLACSTCHVWVHTGLDSLPEVADKENDIMDKAFDVRPESRLACQARVADEDVEVEITEESHRAWLDENPEERKRARG